MAAILSLPRSFKGLELSAWRVWRIWNELQSIPMTKQLRTNNISIHTKHFMQSFMTVYHMWHSFCILQKGKHTFSNYEKKYIETMPTNKIHGISQQVRCAWHTRKGLWWCTSNIAFHQLEYTQHLWRFSCAVKSFGGFGTPFLIVLMKVVCRSLSELCCAVMFSKVFPWLRMFDSYLRSYCLYFSVDWRWFKVATGTGLSPMLHQL